MSYLPRVKIVGTKIGTQGGNLKEIQIMGFENEKGQPFIPVPPTPSAQLEVATPTETSGSTDLGDTLEGTPATFTGGEPPVVVRTRWERSNDGETAWAPLGDYTVDGPTTYTTVAADNDKFLRFTTQATDNEQFVAGSFGGAVGPMTAAPITVTSATKLSNGTFVNPGTVYSFETITCVPAVFSGGFGTLIEKYRIQENTGSAWVAIGGWGQGIPTYDVSQSSVGDQLRCQSRATDATGAQLVSNSPAVTVGTATTIGTVAITPANSTVEPAGSVTLTATFTGTTTNLLRVWSIRNGPGQITSPTNLGVDCEITATGQPGASITVQCDYSDPSASDSPKSTLASIVIQS